MLRSEYDVYVDSPLNGSQTLSYSATAFNGVDDADVVHLITRLRQFSGLYVNVDNCIGYGIHIM